MGQRGKPPPPTFKMIGKGVRMSVDKELYVFRVDGIEVCEGKHADFAGRSGYRNYYCPGGQPHPKQYWIVYKARLFDPENLKRGYVQSFNAWQDVADFFKQREIDKRAEAERSNVNERADDAK